MFVVITRDEAQAKGLKRFYTGEPCKRQHDAERFVSNGGCVECVNRSTPHKRVGIVARNAAWPAHAFVFESQPMPTQTEMQAALRYVEDVRWHEAALQVLRADPALLAQYVTPPTPAEYAAAQALINAAHRAPAHVKTGGIDTPEKLAERNARVAALLSQK